ncbi:hypothetical protein BJ508DRAFT_44958 [Ascobolus immersus RN42]|uniref:Uncharacterized protein n=1 Tax=Ascobolus immersus RN42 TaxID=1160509 RepID=A0A3N4HIT4_ASCIM|nr:hypothetical protein BJ508DRAFT_44958 [Ascobolus immersus RN42]
MHALERPPSTFRLPSWRKKSTKINKRLRRFFRSQFSTATTIKLKDVTYENINQKIDIAARELPHTPPLGKLKLDRLTVSRVACGTQAIYKEKGDEKPRFRESINYWEDVDESFLAGYRDQRWMRKSSTCSTKTYETKNGIFDAKIPTTPPPPYSEKPPKVSPKSKDNEVIVPCKVGTTLTSTTDDCTTVGQGSRLLVEETDASGSTTPVSAPEERKAETPISTTPVTVPASEDKKVNIIAEIIEPEESLILEPQPQSDEVSSILADNPISDAAPVDTSSNLPPTPCINESTPLSTNGSLPTCTKDDLEQFLLNATAHRAFKVKQQLLLDYQLLKHDWSTIDAEQGYHALHRFVRDLDFYTTYQLRPTPDCSKRREEAAILSLCLLFLIGMHDDAAIRCLSEPRFDRLLDDRNALLKRWDVISCQTGRSEDGDEIWGYRFELVEDGEADVAWAVEGIWGRDVVDVLEESIFGRVLGNGGFETGVQGHEALTEKEEDTTIDVKEALVAERYGRAVYEGGTLTPIPEASEEEEVDHQGSLSCGELLTTSYDLIPEEEEEFEEEEPALGVLDISEFGLVASLLITSLVLFQVLFVPIAPVYGGDYDATF